VRYTSFPGAVNTREWTRKNIRIRLNVILPPPSGGIIQSILRKGLPNKWIGLIVEQYEIM